MSGAARDDDRMRRPTPELAAVLAAGLVARAILIPITHGQDFVVWDLAARGTLRGVDVYAHHPPYPGGPFAYLPLFLYVETPLRGLADATGVPFLVLGKLPMLVADLACTLLIAGELRRHGARPRVVAAGAALFFLNPLVLYNSAYYGRFDSVGCALLLLALRWTGSRSAVAYGLAVAAKTFPVFVLPTVLVRAGRARWRTLLTVVVVLVVVVAPYTRSLPALWHDVVGYDLGKTAQGFTVQRLLPRDGPDLSRILLAGYLVGVLLLAGLGDVWLAVAASFVLFLLVSKLVLEQYLTWPMPWLVLLALARPAPARPVPVARSAAGLLAVLTAVGVLANESYHPFGRAPAVLVALLVASCAGFLVVVVWTRLGSRRGRPAPVAPSSVAILERDERRPT